MAAHVAAVEELRQMRSTAKGLANGAECVAAKADLKREVAAITGVRLTDQNDRNQFVDRTLPGAGIEPVPSNRFAVCARKLKSMVR